MYTHNTTTQGYKQEQKVAIRLHPPYVGLLYDGNPLPFSKLLFIGVLFFPKKGMLTTHFHPLVEQETIFKAIFGASTRERMVVWLLCGETDLETAKQCGNKK